MGTESGVLVPPGMGKASLSAVRFLGAGLASPLGAGTRCGSPAWQGTWTASLLPASAEQGGGLPGDSHEGHGGPHGAHFLLRVGTQAGCSGGTRAAPAARPPSFSQQAPEGIWAGSPGLLRREA